MNKQFNCYPLNSNDISPPPYCDPKIKINHKGHILYKISEGHDNIHDQPNTANNRPIQERLINPKKTGYSQYPFNTKSKTNISSIFAKIKDTNIKIENGRLISDKPVMVMIADRSLLVWTTEVYERRILSNKGNSILSGYKINNFYGKSIDVEYKFEYNHWNISPVHLSNFEISGNNHTIVFDRCHIHDHLEIKIHGKNSLILPKNSYKSLKINSTQSTINLNNSDTELFKVNLEGNGTIHGIFCSKKLIANIVGDSDLVVHVDNNTDINKTEFGGAKINLINNSIP